MSAQHGSLSLDSLDDAHLADRQSASGVIRNGSFLISSQSLEAIGNNADASPQVDANMDAPEKGGKRSWQEIKQRKDAAAQAAQAYLDKFDKLGVCSSSPRTQALKDDRDRKEAAENLKREEE
jgi:hypothetical protein